jgi:protein-tyrosine-phosphatase
MKKVLFVCVENSSRSQMAEAFARMHGQGRVEAFSAGSRPSGKVNPKAIAAMKERDYDLSFHTSKSLDQIPSHRFEFVITMGCGDACPHVLAVHREDWDIPDPRDMNPEEFRKVRDSIESKVLDLLDRVRTPSS